MVIFEVAGKMYLRVIPVKALFRSTMVHEVVNRGDVFVVRLEDMALTVLDRSLLPAEQKDYLNVCIMPVATSPAPAKPAANKVPTVTVARMKKEMKKVLDDAQQRLNNI